MPIKVQLPSRLRLALLGGVSLAVMLLIAISPPSNGGLSASQEPSANDQPFPGVLAAHEFPLLDECARSQGTDTLCLTVYTGTMRATYVISSPYGISDVNEYHLANFDQRVLRRSSNEVEVEITSRPYLDTRAPYPLDTDALPESIRSYLVPDPREIQSNDPAIVTLASGLVSHTETQAQAVETILAWVGGHIAWRSGWPNDASAVLCNRSAACNGFSNLSVALCRAAGLPARPQVGCSGGSGTGSFHMWVEVYYPDVGWVASDPQVTVNYVRPHNIYGPWECGWQGTVISQTRSIEALERLYQVRTQPTDSLQLYPNAAQVPALNRRPLKVAPESSGIILPVAQPIGSIALQVENLACTGPGWQIRTGAAWLQPSVVKSDTAAGTALISIDARGMRTGLYTGIIKLYATSDPDEWNRWWIPSRTLTATLRLVDRIHRAYLPTVTER